MLDPKTIQSKTFSRSMRGYTPSEVDEHIAYLTDVYAIAYNRSLTLETELKIKNAALEDYQRNDAQIRRARDEADSLISEARAQSEAILRTTKAACDKIFVDLRKKVKSEKDKLAKISELADTFRHGLFETYNAQIDLIKEYYPKIDPREYSYDEDSFMEDVLEQIKMEQKPLKIGGPPIKTTSQNRPAPNSHDTTLDPGRIMKAGTSNSHDKTQVFNTTKRPPEKTVTADSEATIVNGARQDDSAKEKTAVFTGTFDFRKPQENASEKTQVFGGDKK